MKVPSSLIDKEVRIIREIPIIGNKINPLDIERIDVNYFEYEVSMAKEKYPNSKLIKKLTDMMQELKGDVIALRAHIQWTETTEEAL